MNRYVKFIIPGVLLLVLGIWLFFFRLTISLYR